MARAGLLDVPGDERRPARAGRALRLDEQPQLRRPPGRGRPHPPRQPCDGGGGGDRRPLRRRAPPGDSDGAVSHPHRPGRTDGPGERRHRRDHPEAVPEVDQEDRSSARTCSTNGATSIPAIPAQDPKTRRPNPEFVLNQPRFQGASILLARKNFGCGSSREHAPWALQQFGFRALIAPSYADIFFNNCFKNGLLPIVLPEHRVAALFDDVAAFPRLPADDRSRAAGRRDALGRRDRLRDRAVPQGVPARRSRRHRAHPAPRRQDPRLRGGATDEAAVARDDRPLIGAATPSP